MIDTPENRAIIGARILAAENAAKAYAPKEENAPTPTQATAQETGTASEISQSKLDDITSIAGLSLMILTATEEEDQLKQIALERILDAGMEPVDDIEVTKLTPIPREPGPGDNVSMIEQSNIFLERFERTRLLPEEAIIGIGPKAHLTPDSYIEINGSVVGSLAHKGDGGYLVASKAQQFIRSKSSTPAQIRLGYPLRGDREKHWATVYRGNLVFYRKENYEEIDDPRTGIQSVDDDSTVYVYNQARAQEEIRRDPEFFGYSMLTGAPEAAEQEGSPKERFLALVEQVQEADKKGNITLGVLKEVAWSMGANSRVAQALQIFAEAAPSDKQGMLPQLKKMMFLSQVREPSDEADDTDAQKALGAACKNVAAYYTKLLDEHGQEDWYGYDYLAHIRYILAAYLQFSDGNAEKAQGVYEGYKELLRNALGIGPDTK